MEVEKKLNVSANYFYNRVIESVLYDIRQHTKQSVNKDQLADFSYTKQFSSTASGKITITEIEENRSYGFKTETVKNTFEAKYLIKPIDDTHCKVSYTEKMESNGAFQNMNDMVVGTLLGYFRKKNLKKMLVSIEQM
ncbi:DUF3284 domain-containing protein [Carnobacterium gallinarum]|uniref:DUF3284 domain-containing protein n=1 Tax=Carnobacterium gallinarum TaxID=2749 RepID=UPI000557F7F4|nr:DUF3284 domain-containing protein [Carnobacterium gallinarum]